MTRVVAGSVGGRTLAVPPSGTRPTSERVREALFSRLEHLDAVEDARVLDGYAGSGALGLEAASRGAAHVVLVEWGKAAAEVCRRNVAALGLRDRVDVVRERVEAYVARPVAAPWDLVLLDPPYDVPDATLAEVLAALVPALTVESVVVVERSTRSAAPPWPEGMHGFDTRAYGETAVHLGARSPLDDPASDAPGDAAVEGARG
ncbi:16S rRNA (guanine(966)-N(2))-methyltransferase RsmD [Cellulomonas sp. ACRRI]|uniref:16S rRNA (guanine(966)-N(2))-methyltransferase RsmD n=1 Tax=Cellulomonas sp. ACRRI TaxID=2918188 RepID=UPI001EF209B6|nr:16S rRNA (guanine(966)-N(2))-methyltransferase RsmD [Cellulomonas sp. ACRRI]MCG7287728.1 16S rRNA (guanine(966)-N(2))-methyltransferase RsmD [Cellulomonas sp. ACRRI]